MPFQKGQSGNPAGRPKTEQSFGPLLRRLLADKRAGKTRADHVADRLISMAEQGDINAIRELLMRIDGKITEPIDVTSAGQAFTFTIQAPRDAEGE